MISEGPTEAATNLSKMNANTFFDSKQAWRLIGIAILALTLPLFTVLAADVSDTSHVQSNNPKIKAADASIEKADAEALRAFAQAKVKARQRVITVMKEAKTAAMKAENLNDAIEINKKIEALEAEIDEIMKAFASNVETLWSPVGKTVKIDGFTLTFLPKGKTTGDLNGQWNGISWKQYGSTILVTAGNWGQPVMRTFIHNKKKNTLDCHNATGVSSYEFMK